MTDFFGGVAQVELVDPSSSSVPFSTSFDTDVVRHEDDLAGDNDESDPREEALILEDDVNGEPKPGSGREGNVWAAVLVLGALAGWSFLSGLR